MIITRYIDINASDKLFGKEFDAISEESYKKASHYV